MYEGSHSFNYLRSIQENQPEDANKKIERLELQLISLKLNLLLKIHSQ